MNISANTTYVGLGTIAFLVIVPMMGCTAQTNQLTSAPVTESLIVDDANVSITDNSVKSEELAETIDGSNNYRNDQYSFELSYLDSWELTQETAITYDIGSYLVLWQYQDPQQGNQGNEFTYSNETWLKLNVIPMSSETNEDYVREKSVLDNPNQLNDSSDYSMPVDDAVISPVQGSNWTGYYAERNIYNSDGTQVINKRILSGINRDGTLFIFNGTVGVGGIESDKLLYEIKALINSFK